MIPAKPGQDQHEMQHNQIKSALDGVGDPITDVKRRQARLRHDHAIERVDAAAVGIAPKRR
jgi:hypothetical protein